MIAHIRVDADKAAKLEQFLPSVGCAASKDYLPLSDEYTVLRVVPASEYERLLKRVKELEKPA